MRVIRMATEKQIAFMEKLAQEKDYPLPLGYKSWASGKASKLIDDLLHLNKPVQSLKSSTGRFITPFPKLSIKDEFIEAGFYCLDGEVVKVQLNLAGTKLYAKHLTQIKGGTWYFNYEHGLIAKLTQNMKLEREQAAAFGKIYGYCCICATRLTNEESINKGIGPICAGKQGW